jgi:hypothetical protein
MAEYISRDDLLNVINANVAKAHNERCSQLLEAILNAPAADVVEVVRCKNCINRIEFDTNKFYCELTGYYCGETGYCSDGTPKERGGEKCK